MIRLNHIFHSYKTGRQRINTLADLSLFIDSGEFVCVMGPNGSGKSTLLKLIKGIETPDSGTIEINGLVYGSKEFFEFAFKHIGYITENPYMQVVTPVVFEDLLFGLENLGYEKKEALRRIKEVSSLLEIEHLLERTTDTLSSGELQRVVLAGVLVSQPEIILSDESTSWLDSETSFEVAGFFKKIASEGITVIHVTHNPLEAVLADRVIVLKNGAVIRDGRPESIFSNSFSLLKEGVNVPLSSLLSEALVLKGLKTKHPALFPEELF